MMRKRKKDLTFGRTAPHLSPREKRGILLFIKYPQSGVLYFYCYLFGVGVVHSAKGCARFHMCSKGEDDRNGELIRVSLVLLFIRDSSILTEGSLDAQSRCAQRRKTWKGGSCFRQQRAPSRLSGDIR
ncbi:hypothetical protein CDAR_104291 [Caerostris darwini]|uniref:Uncharacterized protein n=1 Tax=Caerostris darwini TaxID=1538125 RepID=A0AAV4PS26_9ARAC|nr:hypothetical protein CDAR_104291 [Caerostris darwini]